MFRKLVCLLTLLSFCVLSAFPAYADVKDDEIKELKTLVKQLTKRIDKLEKKQSQVTEVAKKEAAKAVKNMSQKSADLPDWAKNIKLGGSMRIRNERVWNDPGENRSMQLVAFTYGLTSKVNDKLTAGISIASGGQSTTSTNQRLDNVFQHPDLSFNLAYLEYTPFESLTLDGGIFKNPYYQVDDLLFDGDVTFHGAAAKYNTDLSAIDADDVDVFANIGAYSLEEFTTTTHDPWLLAGQIGAGTTLCGNLAVKGAIAYYDFKQVQGAILSSRENSNTNLVNNALARDFNVFSMNGAITLKDLFSLGQCDGPLTIDSNNMPLKLIGHFAYNTAAPDEQTGWLFGAQVGPGKLKKGQWKAAYDYRLLEKDAFLDSLPDGTILNGGTNVKAHAITFRYGLLDNTILGVRYYNAEADSGDEGKQDILQTDVTVKF